MLLFLEEMDFYCTLQHFSHSHTGGGGYARCQFAHQKQFGVQYVAQGRFKMQLGEPGIRTSDFPITGQPALIPELQLP